jgi:hypothetical protein
VHQRTFSQEKPRISLVRKVPQMDPKRIEERKSFLRLQYNYLKSKELLAELEERLGVERCESNSGNLLVKKDETRRFRSE